MPLAPIFRRRNTMRLRRWQCFIGIFGLQLILQLPIPEAFAEGYVALYGGKTAPHRFQEVHGTGALSSVELTDLNWARSTVVGAKIGGFLPGNEGWLGIETEFFYTNPHIKQQDITFSAPGVTTTDNFGGAHVRVMTWAVNWVVRYRGKWIQPYIGVGPAVFWARMSGAQAGTVPPDIGTGSDTSAGLNALAGIRLLFTKRLVLFAEYKYNRTEFNFGGTAAIHTLYQPHHGVVGLAVRF
jgi:opacity protein-like surface antigen